MTAERRMFAKTIIDSDAFLDMPLSTQALYFHLSMRADDDGFINNPRKIQRMVGASDDDLKLLIAKNFIIPFDTGVVVIKHWKIHNYIRGDRKHETKYFEELSMLSTKDNGAYTLSQDANDINDNQMSVICQSNDSQMSGSWDTEVRLGKVSNKYIYNNNNNNISLVHSDDKNKAIDDFFERLWKEYPRKQGKSNVSKTAKERLYRIGEERMLKAIERYKDDVKGRDMQYVMQGGRFFNKCYADYLDDENEQSQEQMNMSNMLQGFE